MTFIFSMDVQAQLPGKSETGFLYRQEAAGIATLQTKGWGFGFRYGRQRSAKVKTLYSLDFATMKHDKETRVINNITEDSKGFIYGKMNSFNVIRPQYGQRRILFNKLRDRGVELGYVWSIGPSIGLLKPIYLNVCKATGQGGCIPSEEKYDPEQHSLNEIYGRAPGSKGLNEIKIKPGLSGRFGFYFEFSPFEEGIKALEIGSTLDIFTEDIQIMAGDNNNFWFQSFYISFIFGKKLF